MTPQEVEKALTERLIRYAHNLAAYNGLRSNLRTQIPNVQKLDHIELSAFMHSFSLLQERSDKIDCLRRTLFEDTRRDFDGLFQSRPLDLQVIREAVHIILQPIRKARLYGYASSEESQHLNDSLLPLENALTAAYLGEWLAGDCDNRQTIHGFAMDPYKKENLYKRAVHKEPTEKSLRRMYRKNDTLKMHDALREYQHKLENTPIAEKSKGGGSSNTEIDLIALTWLLGYLDGGLEIIDFLFDRQLLMSTAKDAQTNKERRLSSVCRQYQQFVEKTDALLTGADAPVENNRQYVASSLLLYQLEQSYQFHLNGRIAQRICDGSIDPSQYRPNFASLVLNRYADNSVNLFLPKYTQEGFLKVDSKLDVLHFDTYIDCMYLGEKEDTLPLEVSEAKENTLPLEVREAIELRIILDDAKTLLYALFPPHAQHSWSDSDFCNAAAFFRCDYPITKEFLKIQFPEIPKGRVSKNQENCYLFYRYYRGKYLEMDAKEDSPLSIGREEWKRLKKKATV